ncbi:hypothetical protein SLEP1_g26494 [Rubroshorea leprosula]|uniref:Uncharacterized protein n=1 Tax=Rubroshorea leprosula TaxID=152421 RepID=A0AAV5JYF1_9ROSI|nr:hypothetical protein SLEP1_g26494 [Rubroshorea leprosula]
MMVINPSSSNSVPILASVGSCIFFLLLCHFYVLTEGNPSKSVVMAPIARDITEMGVDPLSEDALRHVERNPMTLPFPMENAASKNNTTFIASILLSPSHPNPPPIPTAEIVKGGEIGNAARNATIANMMRKPRSVSVRGWRNWRIKIVRRS